MIGSCIFENHPTRSPIPPPVRQVLVHGNMGSAAAVIWFPFCSTVNSTCRQEAIPLGLTRRRGSGLPVWWRTQTQAFGTPRKLSTQGTHRRRCWITIGESVHNGWPRPRRRSGWHPATLANVVLCNASFPYARAARDYRTGVVREACRPAGRVPSRRARRGAARSRLINLRQTLRIAGAAVAHPLCGKRMGSGVVSARRSGSDRSQRTRHRFRNGEPPGRLRSGAR